MQGLLKVYWEDRVTPEEYCAMAWQERKKKKKANKQTKNQRDYEAQRLADSEKGEWKISEHTDLDGCSNNCTASIHQETQAGMYF